jgi:signal transduction histidine kinase
MKKRTIILYWLLLLVPTVVVGGAVFQMLRHEQHRIDQQTRFSARDRARAIADTLQITVGAVEDELMKSLRGIEANQLVDTLLSWEKKNPLIRNIFVWVPRSGLQYPKSGVSSTSEERRFMGRYHALFSGRIPWKSAGSETGPSAAAAPASKPIKGHAPQERKGKQTGLIGGIQKLRSARQELVDLAQRKEGRKPFSMKGRAEASRVSGGWIPWFWENRLYILGWIQRQSDGPIYGVELELMTLLSRLIAGFPATAPEGLVYALVDGSGQILHQTGSAKIEPGQRPTLTEALAPHLPHWQVVVYLGDSQLSSGTAGGFMLLSSLLLIIFLSAIVLGGALLTRQAHRNLQDARQKTSFVSNVSHELKTPLTSIRMYAELLNDGRIRGEEKQRQYLEVIVAESQRLTRLVNNVLDFSRLEQGRKQYRLERLEFPGWLRETMESNRLRLEEAGLVLREEMPSEAVAVQADRDALEQIIINLMDNSAKYAAEGGELTVLTRVMDHWLEIRFMDRGPGVPDAHQERIFHKFHRVDDSLTARHPGSGLGLSIARRLARDMGGDLIYEAREGGGSCFVVKIPLEPDAPEP